MHVVQAGPPQVVQAEPFPDEEDVPVELLSPEHSARKGVIKAHVELYKLSAASGEPGMRLSPPPSFLDEACEGDGESQRMTFRDRCTGVELLPRTKHTKAVLWARICIGTGGYAESRLENPVHDIQARSGITVEGITDAVEAARNSIAALYAITERPLGFADEDNVLASLASIIGPDLEDAEREANGMWPIEVQRRLEREEMYRLMDADYWDDMHDQAPHNFDFD